MNRSRPTATAVVGAFGRDTTLAGLVIAAVIAIVSFAPAPDANRLSGDSHDLSHVLIFGLLGLVLSRTLRRWTPRRPGRSIVASVSLAAGFVFGVGTEYAQGFLGGTPSWSDVARDMLGCAVGSSAAFALEGGVSASARRALWAAVLAGIGIGAAPLAGTILDYRARAAMFPVLLAPGAPRGMAFVASFEGDASVEALPPALRPIDAPAAGAEPDAAASRPGSARGAGSAIRAIRVPLDRGRWPGVTLEEPVPDWRGWRAFVVELANPDDQPVEIQVRVNDRLHDNRFEDRFTIGIALPPRSRGRFEFPLADIERAPAGRPMDLAEISKVIVHHVGPAPDRSFFVERLSLSR